MKGKTLAEYEAELAALGAALKTCPLYLRDAWELSYSEVSDLLDAEAERQKRLRHSMARVRSRMRRLAR
jgi:hypothetical protein